MKTTETALVKHLRETIRAMQRETELRDKLIEAQTKLIEEQKKIIEEQEKHLQKVSEMIRELGIDID